MTHGHTIQIIYCTCNSEYGSTRQKTGSNLNFTVTTNTGAHGEIQKNDINCLYNTNYESDYFKETMTHTTLLFCCNNGFSVVKVSKKETVSIQSLSLRRIQDEISNLSYT